MRIKRTDMMSNCPPEFEDRLRDILDHIEGRVDDILNILDEGSYYNYADLDDAVSLIKDLAEDLY